MGAVLLSAEHALHVSEDSFVEVCATELLKTVGGAQQGERTRAGLADHSRIEGATAQVVHRDRAVSFDSLLYGVTDGRSLGLRHEGQIGQTDGI